MVSSSPFALLETQASPPGNPRARVAHSLRFIPRKGRECVFPRQLFLLTEDCGGCTGEACSFSKPVADPGRPDFSLSPLCSGEPVHFLHGKVCVLCWHDPQKVAESARIVAEQCLKHKTL